MLPSQRFSPVIFLSPRISNESVVAGCWKSCLYVLSNICLIWNLRPQSWINYTDDKFWLLRAMFYKLPLKFGVLRGNWSCFIFGRFFSNLITIIFFSNLGWFCDRHYSSSFEQILKYWSTRASVLHREPASACLVRRADETSKLHEWMNPYSFEKH